MEHVLGHILSYTRSLNKFQRTKIIQVTLYNHNAIKLEISNNKTSRKSPNI